MYFMYFMYTYHNRLHTRIPGRYFVDEGCLRNRHRNSVSPILQKGIYFCISLSLFTGRIS